MSVAPLAVLVPALAAMLLAATSPVGRRRIAGGVGIAAALAGAVLCALTLTDVVVEATVVAVLLALTVQAHKRFGTADPDEMGEISG